MLCWFRSEHTREISLEISKKKVHFNQNVTNKVRLYTFKYSTRSISYSSAHFPSKPSWTDGGIMVSVVILTKASAMPSTANWVMKVESTRTSMELPTEAVIRDLSIEENLHGIFSHHTSNMSLKNSAGPDVEQVCSTSIRQSATFQLSLSEANVGLQYHFQSNWVFSWLTDTVVGWKSMNRCCWRQSERCMIDDRNRIVLDWTWSSPLQPCPNLLIGFY